MSRPFSNLAGRDYTAMTGHRTLTANVRQPAHARWRPFLFLLWGLWVSDPDSEYRCLVIQLPQFTHWSKGQCDDGPKQGASRVYGSLPSREPFSADNSSGSSTLRAGVLLYRARLLQNSQLGFDLVIDLLRVRIKGSGNTNPNARPHGWKTDRTSTKKEKKRKKKGQNTRAKQIPPYHWVPDQAEKVSQRERRLANPGMAGNAQVIHSWKSGPWLFQECFRIQPDVIRDSFKEDKEGWSSPT
jgi:hypothetical protein